MRAFVVLFLVACGARTELYSGSSDGGEIVVDAHPIDVHLVDSHPVLDSPSPCVFPDITASITMTADDQFFLYVNGTFIGQNDNWKNAQAYSVTIHRDPGMRNVIAVQGNNVQNTNGRDRGVLLDMRFATEAGQQVLVTNAEWRLATAALNDWTSVTFDDSSWTNAVSEGLYPEGPWGQVFGGLGSKAEWIWSYDSNLPETSKVISEPVYVRRNFYIDASGHVVDAPSVCD